MHSVNCKNRKASLWPQESLAFHVRAHAHGHGVGRFEWSKGDLRETLQVGFWAQQVLRKNDAGQCFFFLVQWLVDWLATVVGWFASQFILVCSPLVQYR